MAIDTRMKTQTTEPYGYIIIYETAETSSTKKKISWWDRLYDLPTAFFPMICIITMYTVALFILWRG